MVSIKADFYGSSRPDDPPTHPQRERVENTSGLMGFGIYPNEIIMNNGGSVRFAFGINQYV